MSHEYGFYWRNGVEMNWNFDSCGAMQPLNNTNNNTFISLFSEFSQNDVWLQSNRSMDSMLNCRNCEKGFSHLWARLRDRLRAVQLPIYSVRECFHLDAQGKQVTLHFNAHRITAYDEKWIALVWMNRCSISALPTENEMHKCKNARILHIRFLKIGFRFDTPLNTIWMNEKKTQSKHSRWCYCRTRKTQPIQNLGMIFPHFFKQ